MTTTVRSVRVELEMGIASYVANAHTAGRETDAAFSRAEAQITATDRAVGNLDKSTGSLSRTSAQARVQQTQLGDGIDKVGRSASRSETAIDKYSGRLKTILGLVQLLGPAALRLGAGALPAVSAGLVGIGAAGGGIAVTALALHGVGDALKAIDKYDTDRSAESLQALRVELERLGPDGAHFVQVLHDLQPQIHGLQLLARAGVLPGFENLIDSMVTRLPVVTKIVNRLSREVGLLATDAGVALAGDRWTPFFDYVKSSAAPILDDFARSTGNVALGLANILVAFDPLTRSFTAGLEDMTGRFADWSTTLDDNEGFQSFLDTVKEAGPELVDFLGSTIGLFAGLVRASAPLGAVTLPIITGIVKAFAAIANSPIGPAIYTAAAAWMFYNRAASLAEGTTARIQSTWGGMSRSRMASGAVGGLGLLALSLTDVEDKAGLANTALFSMAGLMVGGPWGLAIGAGIGAVTDFHAAQGDLNDELDRTREIARSGTLAEQQAEYERLTKEIEHSGDSIKGWLLGTQAQKSALSELDGAMKNSGGLADLFAGSVGLTARQLEIAATSAEDFSGALANLNGWFSKRDAIRSYRDAIDELRKSLKDGFSRKDAANLDALGQSILQVATNIKNPAVRGDFLAGARAQLVDMAEHAAPKAAAAIQRIIDKFDDEGLTHPKFTPTVDDSRAQHGLKQLKHTFTTTFDYMNQQRATPTIDADANPFVARSRQVRRDLNHLDSTTSSPTLDANANPFLTLNRQVTGDLNHLDSTTASPRINVEASGALNVINQVTTMLRNLNGDTATTFVRTVRTDIPLPGQADGGTVGGQRSPYGDKVHAMLAPGEEIISNRHGQADRFRADRAAGRIPRYADGGMVKLAAGGTVANTYTTRYRGDTGNKASDQSSEADKRHAKAADAAAKALAALEQQARKLQRTEDKIQAKRDALQSHYDSVFSSTISQLTSNIFATSEAPTNPWAAGAKPGGVMDPIGVLQSDIANATLYDQLVAALKGRGLSQSAIEAIAAEGLPALQAVAGYSDAALQQFQQLFTQREQLVGAAAADTGVAVVGKGLERANNHLERIEDRLHDVEQAIHQASKDNKQANKDNSEDVGHWINGTAAAAHRRGRG